MTLESVYNYFASRYKLLACRIRNLENGSTPADGNGIYSADGSVANGRTVNLLGILNFLGAGAGREFYIEIGNGVDTFTQLQMEFDSMTVGYVDASDTNTLVFDTNGTTVSGFLNLETYTPSGVGDTAGVPGSMCWDASFFYVKTANHVWERVALTPIP